MKVVVDEGVPRQLVRALCERGIDASRFPRGWTSLDNGKLIKAAMAAGFDVLVTNDKNIVDQQSLEDRNIAVVALPHNQRRAIVARVDDVDDTIRRAEPGMHIVIGLDGARTIRRLRAGVSVTTELPPVATFRF